VDCQQLNSKNPGEDSLLRSHIDGLQLNSLTTISQQYLCRQPAIWVIKEKKRLKTIEGMGFCKKRVHAKIFDL